MAAPTYPRTISFENGRVRVAKRASGAFSLSWKEKGGTRKTTITSEVKALQFATEKAREINSGSGRQWIAAVDVDALRELQKLAGAAEGAVPRLLADVKGALGWLAGKSDLTTAARHFAEHGPLRLATEPAATAIERFLAEYLEAPEATRRTFGTELNGFLTANPGLMVADLNDEARLAKWVKRPTPEGGKAAPRTVRNRATTWVTLFNRLREWKLLPESGKHAAEMVRKRHVPVIPDAGKEILSIDQGRKLLAAVRAEEPKLEAFLLVAGWIGLRPSECQRLTWSAFDWKRGFLHVTAAVAGKTSTERFVPVEPRLLARLGELKGTSSRRLKAKVCGFRSREFLSALARRKGIVDPWPPDVLRHSFCSYRIAIVGSLDKVADEAGNSPRILKSNYRRPVLEEDGLAWWNLLNPQASSDSTGEASAS